jgi:hypothetical protein
MGPGIIIPVLVLSVVLPLALMLARRRFKAATAGGGASGPGIGTDPSVRLTSNALRAMTSPPWRVIHEIAPQRLGGIDHVVIGPAGVLPLVTSIDQLPRPPFEHDPTAVAAAAVQRSELDDALRRCAMSSDRLVVVHWGAGGDSDDVWCEPVRGVTAVDGRALLTWLEQLDTTLLSPAQVDLAWATTLTAIGRPNPLA